MQLPSTRWLANLNGGRSQFFHKFGAHMNILFIVKVNVLVLIKCSYRSPHTLLIIDPRMVIIF
jgi:hypothetical protein